MANRALNDSFSAPVLHTKVLNSPSAEFLTKEELNVSIVASRKEMKEDISSIKTSFVFEIKDCFRTELKIPSLLYGRKKKTHCVHVFHFKHFRSHVDVNTSRVAICSSYQKRSVSGIPSWFGRERNNK